MEHPFRCDICNAHFTRKTNLKNHIKVLHQEELLKFICPLFPACKSSKCDGYFYPITNLNLHFKRAHKSENVNDYKDKIKKVYVDRKSK